MLLQKCEQQKLVESEAHHISTGKVVLFIICIHICWVYLNIYDMLFSLQLFIIKLVGSEASSSTINVSVPFSFN